MPLKLAIAAALATACLAGAACSSDAAATGTGPAVSRTVQVVPPRTLADVAAQVPDGLVVTAVDVLPAAGDQLSLRLSEPTRSADLIVSQYSYALRRHVEEMKRLLTTGGTESDTPDEQAATAREVRSLDELAAAPATPTALLVTAVRLRGTGSAIAAFQVTQSSNDAGTK